MKRSCPSHLLAMFLPPLKFMSSAPNMDIDHVISQLKIWYRFSPLLIAPSHHSQPLDLLLQPPPNFHSMISMISMIRPRQVILLFSSFKPPIQSKSTIFFIFAHEVGGLLLPPSSQFDLFHWLKTGPSILGFCFGTFYTTGFPGLVFSNSLTETFSRLCCKTLPTRFPALP